jgi:hypothetical protein
MSNGKFYRTMQENLKTENCASPENPLSIGSPTITLMSEKCQKPMMS